MNRAITLILTGLVLSGGDSTHAQSERNQIILKDTFHLSLQTPIHILALDDALLKKNPEELEISQAVTNPHQRYYLVQVFLASGDVGVHLGNFAGYPPDAAGDFLMRFDKPLKELQGKLSDAGKRNNKVQLKFIFSQRDSAETINVNVTQIKFFQKLDHP